MLPLLITLIVMLSTRAAKIQSSMILFVLIAVFSPRVSAADDYVWPMRASKELTSGFCQWRSGHFHSGIDIRTFGKTGYKVRAIADGYAWRIVTRWRGYGKALYLKLDDGRIAVYGHLLKFTPEINRYVQEQQLVMRRYKTDLYPLEDQFRFKAGDIVAYTGKSGTGAPHLHFEIRSDENMPLSPLPFYPSIIDNRAPAIRGISLRPLSPVSSRIDGNNKLTAIRLRSIAGKYVSSDTIVIYGPVGAEVDCVDKRPSTKRSYAVSKIEIFIDSPDNPFFVTTYDSLSFDRWGEVNLELNYSHALRNEKFVHNLYLFNGNNPPLVNDLARNRGIIEAQCAAGDMGLSPGLHKLLLRVHDPSGNTSQAEIAIDLRCLPRPFAVIGGIKDQRDSTVNVWTYEVALLDSICSSFHSILSGKEASDFVKYLSGDTSLLGQFRKLRGETVLLSAIANDGVEFDCILRISVTGMPVMVSHTTIPPIALSNTAVESRYDPVEVNIGKLVEAWNGQAGSAKSLFFGLPVLFDRSDSSFWCDPVDISVSDTIYTDYGRPFAAGGTGLNSIVAKFADGHLVIDGNDLLAKCAVGLDTVGTYVKNYGPAKAFVIEPEDLLLNDWLDIAVTIPESFDALRSGFYKLDEEGNAAIVEGKAVSDSIFLAKLSKFGTYALLQDTIPPMISGLKPGNGGHVGKSRPKITFKLEDDLSGIGDDTDVEITVDGVWAIPEYDIASKWMETYSSQKLRPGKHWLKITVRDKAGNETTHSSSFRYVRSGKKK